MKKSTILISITAALILGFASCEKTFFDDDPESFPMDNFDYLWNELNNKYAFFELKDINPDEIYEKYSSQVFIDTDDTTLFRIMGEMLNELKDGHVNLVSPFNVSRYDITLLGPENIDTRLVSTEYLRSDYYTTGPFVHNFISDGKNWLHPIFQFRWGDLQL
jgi:hypothetical protein